MKEKASFVNLQRACRLLRGMRLAAISSGLPSTQENASDDEILPGAPDTEQARTRKR